jgi:NAD(P)-dependent dehydrogenase (short-subunit alcohol dehydrogenase family)
VDHANTKSPSALASLTKGELAAVTPSLATEYASRGVPVNAGAPGVIQTPFNDPLLRGRETLHIDGGQAAGH